MGGMFLAQHRGRALQRGEILSVAHFMRGGFPRPARRFIWGLVSLLYPQSIGLGCGSTVDANAMQREGYKSPAGRA